MKNFVKEMKARTMGTLERIAEAQLQMKIESEIREILEKIRGELADPLIAYGFKAYSQCDEDGIIQEIFRRIGVTHKTFVEIGVGNGTENNTHFLLLNGWKGVWIEGNHDYVKSIKENTNYRKNQILSLQGKRITKENCNETILTGLQELKLEQEIDFFSLDIDGNDYHILQEITAVSPRVICIEYNAKFPPPTKITIPYEESHYWKEDDYMGASLQMYVDYLRAQGYVLITCNITGANAFFVREELICGEIVLHPPEKLFQPPRYYLSYRQSGHKPSLKYLANLLHSSGNENCI